MRAEGGEDYLCEPGAGGLIDVSENLPAHAGVPKTVDVIGDGLDAFGFVWLGFEEFSDTVRHLDEMVHVHS